MYLQLITVIGKKQYLKQGSISVFSSVFEDEVPNPNNVMLSNVVEHSQSQFISSNKFNSTSSKEGEELQTMYLKNENENESFNGLKRSESLIIS